MKLSITIPFGTSPMREETIEITSDDQPNHRECLKSLAIKLDKIASKIGEEQDSIREIVANTRSLKSEYGSRS
jgi:hypothetical protein